MKKAMSLFLVSAMLLSLTACGEQNQQPQHWSSSTAEVSSVTAESTDQPQTTTTAATTTNATTVKELPAEPAEKIPESLYDITLGELRNAITPIKEQGRTAVHMYSSNPFRVWDNYTVAFDHDDVSVEIRESSRILRDVSIDSDNEIKQLADDKNYKQNYNFESGYDIRWEDQMLKFSEDFSSGLKAEYFQTHYCIGDSFTIRGFIKKTGDSRAEFIIDPAYCYGLPMMSSLPENMTYTINGRKLYADTLSFSNATVLGGTEMLPDTGMVYAEVAVNGLEVKYRYSDDDNIRGYDNECTLSNVKVLFNYDKINDVIDNGYLFSDGEKDPQLTETYNAIINNLDKIYNAETTLGMTLVDMDFDGNPELLVSDYMTTPEENTAYYQGTDVTVYRIENGELRNVGVIPNALSRPAGDFRNVIGVKNLGAGQKAWFVTTYKNLETGEYTNDCDYLYTLNGDKLEATELFRAERIVEGTDENGFDISHTDYYAYGEKMDIEVTPNTPPEDEEGQWFENTYSWGGYSSVIPMALFGEIRGDYADDITEIYNLSCDWLSSYTNPKTITERELTYNIAAMVDGYYLGVYDPKLQNYRYYFVGAYAKPVIYLYPEETTEVSVEVGFKEGGEITVSYPEYNSGWNVTAHPDGTLFDSYGNEYYCLYWEGEGASNLDLTKGFCVKGEDTAAFLREKLLHIGLTPREANEFIIYWLPLMQNNEYNIISLHTEQYKNSVPLTVSPKPDSEIRVFMTFNKSDEFVEIAPQNLPSYERNGFTLVEWGGGEY